MPNNKMELLLKKQKQIEKLNVFFIFLNFTLKIN